MSTTTKNKTKQPHQTNPKTKTPYYILEKHESLSTLKIMVSTPYIYIYIYIYTHTPTILQWHSWYETLWHTGPMETINRYNYHHQ